MKWLSAVLIAVGLMLGIKTASAEEPLKLRIA